MRSLWWDQSEDEDAFRPRRRGLWIALLWSLGIVLAWQGASASLWLIGIALACVLGACVSRGWVCRVMVGAALVCASVMWADVRVMRPSPESLLSRSAGLAPGQRALVTLTGVVTSDPGPIRRFDPYAAYEQRRDTGQQLTLSVRAIGQGEQRESASGEVVLNVYAPMPELRAGDWARVTGWLTPVQGPMNPGERDARRWAAQDGQGGWMTIANSRLIERVERPDGLSVSVDSWAYAGLARLRAGAQGLLDSALDAPQRGAGMIDGASEREASRATLEALLVGTYEPEVREVSQAFTRLGLVHALSISGFHIAVMATVILFLVRLTGDRGWVEPMIVAALVVVYLLIVPARAPMVRSGVMVLALLIVEAMDRRYDRLNLLGYIATALLIWRPLDVFDAGFQLSFGVTAALMWLARPVYERWFARGVRGRIREPARGVIGWIGDELRKLASSCVLAWGVSTPLVMFHAGVLSPLAFATSIVVLPIVTLTLWVGYIALVLELITRALGIRLGVGGWVLENLGVGLVRVTAWIDQLPGMALMMPPVGVAWTIASTGLIVWALRWPARMRVWRYAASAACVLWLGAAMVSAGLIGDERVRVDSLSVSPGACSIVRAGSVTMMIDAGGPGVESSERTIVRSARALGAWRIPIVVLTHSAPEHWRALPGIARTLGVRQVLVSPSIVRLAEDRRDGPHARLVRELAEVGVEVRAIADGQALDVGDARVRVEFVVGTRDGLRPHEVGVIVRSDASTVTIAPRGIMSDPRVPRGERIVSDDVRKPGSERSPSMTVRIDRDGKLSKAPTLGP